MSSILPQDKNTTEWRLMDFVCETCGKVFKSRKACATRIPKYCSRECCGKSKQIPSFCENCCAEYFTGGNRRNKRFCSNKCAYQFKRGKPLSDHHRAALSEAKEGKPIPHLHTLEVRERISEALMGKPQPWNRGENHPRYTNGGANRTERANAMGTLEYKEWRRKVFERDNYTCRECGVKGGRLRAHHVKPWQEYPELRFEIDNGLTLCADCHIEVHKRERLSQTGLDPALVE